MLPPTKSGNSNSIVSSIPGPATIPCSSESMLQSRSSSFCGCANSGNKMFSTFFEYETPKVVTVQNVPLGILRLLLQVLVVSFVVFYQLWYARGYQGSMMHNFFCPN